jgi:hypothetical protein
MEAVPEDRREAWDERVAIMSTAGGLPRAEATCLAEARLQYPAETRWDQCHRDNCEERHQQPRAEGPGMMVSETQLVNALKWEQLLPSNMRT